MCETLTIASLYAGERYCHRLWNITDTVNEATVGHIGDVGAGPFHIAVLGRTHQNISTRNHFEAVFTHLYFFFFNPLRQSEP